MTTHNTPTATSTALRTAWVEHPHHKYRGCAPDPDRPGRAAGDPELSLDAWHGKDRDGAEPQRERAAREDAAIEVCLNCPVMVQCDAYANSVLVEDGKARLAEPAGIWGARRALERHRAFIATRHQVAAAASDKRLRTPQKTAVLRALARCWEPFEVAERAGVDVRTANWQRSNLTTLLGLPRDATRMRMLAAAVERGLLEGAAIVADDGAVPAVPPPTRVSAPPEPTQLSLWAGDLVVGAPAARRSRARRSRVRRTTPPVAPVIALFPVSSPLGVAV